MNPNKLLEIMDRCPERIETACVFQDQLPAPGSIPRAVFFSYSGGNVTNVYRASMSRTLREELEDIVKHENIDFSEYSSETQFSIRCEGVCRRIQQSGILIADITPIEKSNGDAFFSPNVLFELGIAWGNRREILLISCEEIEIPSLLRDLNYFIYPRDFENGKFIKQFRKSVRNCSPFRTGIRIMSNMHDALEAIISTEEQVDHYRHCCAYPSFLYRCEDSALHYVKHSYTGTNEQRLRFNQLKHRILRFREQLRKAKVSGFTYYHLYHRESFESYVKTGIFKNGPEEPLSKDLRCKDIQCLIDTYCEFFPNLKIRFMDEPLAYNWVMRPDYVLYIDAHNRVKGGLSGIVISNRETLIEFNKDFDRLWRICDIETDEKEYTTKYLNNLMKEVQK